MTMIHVYRAASRSACYVVDRSVNPPMTFRLSPRQRIRTDCCKRLRWAMYVEMQVYYDCTYRWCMAGHGCKKGLTE